MFEFIYIETIRNIKSCDKWRIPVTGMSQKDVDDIIQQLKDNPEELWEFDPTWLEEIHTETDAVEISSIGKRK